MSGNPHCECCGPGWCARHKMGKTKEQYAQCKGVAPGPDGGWKQFVAWERGLFGATKPECPIANPQPFVDRKIPERVPGDRKPKAKIYPEKNKGPQLNLMQKAVSGFLSREDISKIDWSAEIEASRKARATPKKNQSDFEAFSRSKVPQLILKMIPLFDVPINRNRLVTHILYHFLPLGGPAEQVWRRHVEWIKEIRNQYNGRLIVGIAKRGQTDRPGPKIMPPEAVMEAMGGLDAEFITAVNHPKIGEGVTFPEMLKSIKTNDPDEVFFYGHTKGVTRWSYKLNEPPHLWAEAMFDTLFRNRDGAVSELDTHGVTGPFRMPGGMAMGRPGIGPWWFFSGTFFAARCIDVFKRDWEYLPGYYGCVEQWPRLNFDKDDQSSCLFFDKTDNLYDADYWKKKVWPAITKWRESHPEQMKTKLSETVSPLWV